LSFDGVEVGRGDREAERSGKEDAIFFFFLFSQFSQLKKIDSALPARISANTIHE
jgi:hypothetical protein